MVSLSPIKGDRVKALLCILSIWSCCCAFAFAFAFASAPASASASASEALELLTEDNSPLNFRNQETGTIEGAGHDLVMEIMRRADVSYSVKLLPWKRAYRQAQETPGTCLYSMNRTPEREALFAWVGPLLQGGWALYQRPDNTIELTDMADIKNYSVVARDGDAAVASFRSEHPSARLITTTTHEMALQLLYRKRGQLLLTGVLGIKKTAVNAAVPMPKFVYHWKRTDISLGCSKGTSPALIEKLNAINQGLDVLRHEFQNRYWVGE